MSRVYRSNGGRGPLLARVVADDGRVLTMERWHENRPRRATTFRIAKWFLDSPNCGWKPVRAKAGG